MKNTARHAIGGALRLTGKLAMRPRFVSQQE
jgi:hypothetical protein